ncbi:hypothetical protein PVAP13_9KG607900 [Panicum virgatum]|uniref:RIN4 pathogenic type III effector avirulence factor Avr cleavage site domain-containing protein n=1 Tax=Panicum virgatum TaxID=38727 RepID=A0A8T0NWY6_PANVG|nr:hypothetical protein PVAP13_9KG607900 [Panicum virgatum]
MEKTRERGQDAAGGSGWMTVPAFGDWDMKNGALPDYSMDFSKIREMRKQNKKELSRASLGGDEDLSQAHQQQRNQPQAKAQPKLGRPADDHRRQLHDSPTVNLPSLHAPRPTSSFLSSCSAHQTTVKSQVSFQNQPKLKEFFFCAKPTNCISIHLMLADAQSNN